MGGWESLVTGSDYECRDAVPFGCKFHCSVSTIRNIVVPEDFLMFLLGMMTLGALTCK